MASVTEAFRVNTSTIGCFMTYPFHTGLSGHCNNILDKEYESQNFSLFNYIRTCLLFAGHKHEHFVHITSVTSLKSSYTDGASSKYIFTHF
jgi:hypothetical protein